MRKLPAKLSSQAVPCHTCDWLPQKIMPLCLHSCCQLHYCLYPYHVCWISFKHITYTLLNAINWSNIFFHLGSSWLNYSYPSVTPVRMKLSCLFWLNCVYIYILIHQSENTCSLGHFGGDSLDHHHSKARREVMIKFIQMNWYFMVRCKKIPRYLIIKSLVHNHIEIPSYIIINPMTNWFLGGYYK